MLQTRPYKDTIMGTGIPQLGICGGHQIIAHFCGSRLGPLRKLRGPEPDLNPEYNPGFFKEKGVFAVRILVRDPLFKGLRRVIRVTESHYWEVKRPGRRLQVLAASDDCPVQAFVHRGRMLYGVQFHPERHSEAYPDGRKLLLNFFDLARGRSRTVRT